MDRMARRLPDIYDKSDNSNVNKLFRILSSEIENVNDALAQIKDWRDVDQMEGEALDRLGEMLSVDRQGRGDLLYRRMIKLQIIINQSAGDIETLNSVAGVLLGDPFIGIDENWQDEPASFFVVYNYFELYQQIVSELQDYEDDPWFLDGEYNLDGEKLLDGGTSFDIETALSDVMTLIDETKHSIEMAKSAGVKVYFKFPFDLENEFDIQQVLNIDLMKTIENIVDIQQELMKVIKKNVEQQTLFRLDGGFELDGSLKLDANRETIEQRLNIEVV